MYHIKSDPCQIISNGIFIPTKQIHAHVSTNKVVYVIPKYIEFSLKQQMVCPGS